MMNSKKIRKYPLRKNRCKGILVFVFFTFFIGASFGQSTNAADCGNKLGEMPSISFQSNSAKLLDDSKAMLLVIADKLKNNPSCKLMVISYGSSNKKTQQLSWDHTNVVINYLVDKEGLSADRFIFNYGQEGDPTLVDFRAPAAGEEGPSTVPPPHPTLRRN